MKEYKKTIIITSIITMLPFLIGVLLWNRLPDTIATHFGTGNEPNGWSSKTFTVVGMPALLLGIHLFTILITLNDPKRQNIGKKLLRFVFWIIPVISVLTCASIYGYALGMAVDIEMIVSVIVGSIFIIMGNYMSKNRQNYTVGIKLPWTLNSQENWNRTHRMASKLWIVSGFVVLINIFMNSIAVVLVVICASALLPMIYSFVLYKRGI